ncbi:MAG: glycosyltransferase family 4 protein [Anaerolineales bacterium]
MHILIIHQAFAALNEPGGTRHAEFARLLTARGHRVTVIASPVSYLTGEKNSQPEEDGGARVIRVPVYGAYHQSFFHRLLAFFSFTFSAFFAGLKVRDVDVVWGTSPPIFQGVAAWKLAWLKRAKFLFEVRDLWPQFAVAIGALKNPLLIFLSEWLERFLYRSADVVMVNSPAYLPHVQRRGARRAALIPNGADPAMFESVGGGEDFRAQHQLDGKFVALYAGAHGVSNDLPIVLQAAQILTDSNIHIILLGDGKEKSALMNLARQMNLANVTFLPSVPKREMARALAGADACIAILKPLEEYKRTYPNKVFDYMAAGKPIALSIDGVIREVVDAAGCGVFAQPGNAAALAAALQALAGSPLASAQMGARGREYLKKNFSREAAAQALFNLLEEVA